MAASSSNVKLATPEVIVQLNLGLDPVELSPEMKQIEQGGYAYGKARFCGKDVHYAGDINILTEKRFVSIAISEGSHLDGITIAKRAAASVAERGFANIIVGGTRGTEMHIIREFIANGGKVVALIPMGIGEYGKKFITDEVRQFISDGTLILVSQFPASYGWSKPVAQLRNILIAKACSALFIAECRGEKGVWNLAEDFRSANKTIYVPTLTNVSRMEHHGLVGAMGAIELAVEGDEDMFKLITRI